MSTRPSLRALPEGVRSVPRARAPARGDVTRWDRLASIRCRQPRRELHEAVLGQPPALDLREIGGFGIALEPLLGDLAGFVAREPIGLATPRP